MRYNIYLNFNGNASDAFELYSKAFKQENPTCMRFKDNPQMEVSKEEENKILHSEIVVGGVPIMISDVLENDPVSFANNITINITVDTEAEFDEMFAILGVGAKIELEPQETFFAKKYTIFADKFGVRWMMILQPTEQ